MDSMVGGFQKNTLHSTREKCNQMNLSYGYINMLTRKFPRATSKYSRRLSSANNSKRWWTDEGFEKWLDFLEKGEIA